MQQLYRSLRQLSLQLQCLGTRAVAECFLAVVKVACGSLLLRRDGHSLVQGSWSSFVVVVVDVPWVRLPVSAAAFLVMPKKYCVICLGQL